MAVNDQKEVKDESSVIENEEKKEESISEKDNKQDQEKADAVMEESKENEVEEPVEAKEEVDSETAGTSEQTEEKEEKEEKKAVSEEKESDQKNDDMMKLLNESFNKFKQGEIIEGDIVSVDENEVLIDIGFKSEGSISSREFSSSHPPKVGSKIKVYIESIEDNTGRMMLSKKKADFYANLEKLKETMENNGRVKGILRKRVKGGMIVDIDNLEAFLPGSHVSIKPIPNLDQFIGKESEFKILKIDKERRNIIVSRRKVMEEEQNAQIDELKEKLEVGTELDGEVRNITEYGAFIDLGGIDGLLHITDMSWGHINHPSDMLNIGDKVRVKVLDYDIENSKVSLGLKQLVPHPWKNIETKYPEGSNISGKVVNITNYGAFIELESGVEGLVHVSEMSWTKKIKHPNRVLKVGDTVKAIVLSTSKEEERISLGIKQMDPNPWLTIDDRYPVDSALTGRIRTIMPFGVFVEIEQDIEGLVHISDISWTKRIYHPREVYKKGQKIKVKILSIDKTLHRISLGVKQLEMDPWEKIDEVLPINSETKASIVKLISKGVLVDVKVGNNLVEGFVPLSHLAIPNLKNTFGVFKMGEELPLKVIELDIENRRLILSAKAYFFAREKKELQDYIAHHKIEAEKKKEENKEKEPKPVTEKKKVSELKQKSEEKKITEPEKIETTEEKTEETPVKEPAAPVENPPEPEKDEKEPAEETKPESEEGTEK